MDTGFNGMTDNQVYRLSRQVYFRIADIYRGGLIYGIDLRTISEGWKRAYNRVIDEMVRRGLYPFGEN